MENGANSASSPPSTSGQNNTAATSSRLTGRTASQVQGAARVSNQLGMNENVCIVYTLHSARNLALDEFARFYVSQSIGQQQQQLLTGRPLMKGQEGILPFQQPHMGSRPPMIAPFNPQLASNAAITGVAVKLLEQQQQHQFLAAALAINQNQLKQQQLQQQQQQQQQRTSPLQQSLMSFAGGMPANRNAQTRGIPPNVPVANQSHFRPIHPQPMVPTVSGETSNVFSL